MSSKDEVLEKELQPVEVCRLSDTEPKTLCTKNLNIQGIYGLEPGDSDPDFKSEERLSHSRGFDTLGTLH